MNEIIWGRYSLLIYTGILSGCFLIASFYNLIFTVFLLPTVALFLIATKDFLQKKRSILSNFPLLGRFRFFFESIRPELRQYYWESDDDEVPYSRNQRSMVYQRSKNIGGVRPFGSLEKFYENDFVWLNHSISPTHIKDDDFRTKVGLGKNSYSMSVLNISGTSFGALSPPAITSLNKAAKMGGFAHNTGEGSLSPYHEKGKGDSIWQISTGYFGCRDKNGNFNPKTFSQKSKRDQVKMIEIKLSQGAKPGHGGMLLAPKVTEEIALTRGINVNQDCISPAKHKEFSNPSQLLKFVEKLRKLSGGKPVGIKLCVGHPWELISIIKTMVEKKSYIDFITVDGAEGGTGAAPAEFTDHIGCPLKDAIVFVDNALVGANLRDRIKIGASGKIVSAFDIAHICALGADWVNMARPFMFAIGCIQCRSCHTGECPTGIATMDPMRYRAIDVNDRSERANNFHKNTLFVLKELLESVGVNHTKDLNRRHIVRRLSESEIRLADQIYPRAEKGELLKKGKKEILDPRLNVYWNKVSSKSFNYIPGSI
ncbi:MAG: FMN-binding glutamate synthase family protein [Rickettsiales bacterium]|nr:FMN-binding glutamate synthase family protein [Rickettsiales bacterium]|tara:strand:- start:4793 stop:6412 length:1620 start_codon:yes stop_codon:yes gene_type:complete